MKAVAYIQFEASQLEKIGHSIVFFAERITGLTKTKLLKLLYILDEISIKKSGIPMLNLTYKVWKFGPVSEEIFVDLSIEPALLAKFIDKKSDEGFIVPKIVFDDGEFSDNDLELLEFVVKKYGEYTAAQLVAYTHREGAPWHIAATEHAVLKLLEGEAISNTEYVVDMKLLIAHDARKLEVYNEYVETH